MQDNHFHLDDKNGLGGQAFYFFCTDFKTNARLFPRMGRNGGGWEGYGDGWEGYEDGWEGYGDVKLVHYYCQVAEHFKTLGEWRGITVHQANLLEFAYV